MEKVHVKIKRGIWFFVAALIFAVAIGCSRQTEFETQARSDEELLAMYGVVPLDPETYVKPIPAVPGSERDLAILELLFRLTMAWNDNISCWYLDYGEGSDAPPEFMERFKDIPLTIKTYSEVARDPLHGSVLKHDGKQAAIAAARIVRWVDGKTAEVEFSHYIGPLAAGGMTCLLKYNRGSWQLEIKTLWRS